MERSYLFSGSLVARTYDVSSKNVDFTDVTSSQHLIPSATFSTFYKFKRITSFPYNYASKRRAIGRSTPQARKRRALRASESDEQRALKLENLRVHATETRSSESSDQREVRLETDQNHVLIRSDSSTRENFELREKEGCKMSSNKHCSIKMNTAR
ncbi:hypothetical protein TNCV_1273761 [Trichonephila clavipes]|nr:hypothetical protein TNCV_1273761 [Trichonephila clavipes]